MVTILASTAVLFSGYNGFTSSGGETVDTWNGLKFEILDFRLAASAASVLASKWLKEVLKYWLYGSYIKWYSEAEPTTANISDFISTLNLRLS